MYHPAIDELCLTQIKKCEAKETFNEGMCDLCHRKRHVRHVPELDSEVAWLAGPAIVRRENGGE